MDETPNNGCSLNLNGTPLRARASGSLWLPDQRTLIVSDLHLGKAERHARRSGGLWPPYENAATLSRLEAEVEMLCPDSLVALGDSFDDNACIDGLTDRDRGRIVALAEGRRLIWISGNHDPLPTTLPGEPMDEMSLGSLTLRHIAVETETGELSGHYHPKATIHARGRRISRKCFVFDKNRLILPAFGAYTGGLDVLNPAIASLFDETAEVILTGETVLRTPFKRLRQLAA